MKIDSYIAKTYKIDTTKKYQEEWIEARELLCCQRLDIIVKWIYIDYLQYNTDYGNKLYKEHIRAITKDSYIEGNNENKKGIECYIESFKELIESIKANGFQEAYEPIPVDENNIILDGAHRTAVCAYFGKKIKIIRIPIDSKVCYDAHYFLKQGMADRDIDFIIQKYIELTSKNIFIANIWPSAVGKRKETDELIQSMAAIAYTKTVSFNYTGGFHYLQQVYNKDQWIGTLKDGFPGVYRKLEPCFRGSKYLNRESNRFSKVKIYMIEDITSRQVKLLKKRIRANFKMGKHSVHITDTREEGIQMGQLIFNQNSIDFMNAGNPFRYKKNYSELQKFFNNRKKEDYLICGSTILSLFGIRKSNDIDYLLFHMKKENSDWKHAHNKYQSYFKGSIDDLFCNPNHYFYYSGLKCLSLDDLKYFKEHRRERKDLDDIKLIDGMRKRIQGNYSKQELWIRNSIVLKRRIIGKLQGIIIQLTHVTGTYHLAKRLYHLWKGQI